MHSAFTIRSRSNFFVGGHLKLQRLAQPFVAAGVVVGLLATSAPVSGFTPGDPAFSATTYASGLATDGLGRGWLGLAFSTGAILYGAGADGELYVASAPGTGPVTMKAVGAIGTGASGLTFGLDGKLYAARHDDVVEIDAASAGVLRRVAASPGLAPPAPWPLSA